MATLKAVVNPTIYMNGDTLLTPVEGVIEQIILARYGEPPAEGEKSGPVPVYEDWGVVVELEKMRMREDIVTAFHGGSLTLRDSVGSVLRALPGRGLDSTFIERDALTEFAKDQWMVSVMDVAPEHTQETHDERCARLAKRRDELISQRFKGWQKKIAAEEGLSVSRVKQILKRSDGQSATNHPLTWPKPRNSA